MSERTQITFPIGRLVAGSLYTGRTTDRDGEPLTYKKGVNKGQPRTDYSFCVVIAKTGVDWKLTPWGRQMVAAAEAAWPQGQSQYVDFSWKVQDGDSSKPSGSGKAPNHYEHNRGHWVVWFSSPQRPLICDAKGTKYLPEAGLVKRGYFIQVVGSYVSNVSSRTPGMFLGPEVVAFSDYGEEIESGGVDLATVTLGGDLPVGALSTAPVAEGLSATVPPAPPVPPVPPVVPAEPVMLPAAGGVTYAALVGAGWTREQMVSAGFVAA